MCIRSILDVYLIIFVILYIISKIKGMSFKEFIKVYFPILLFLCGISYVIIAAVFDYNYKTNPDDNGHTMEVFSISTFGISLMITGYSQFSKENKEITELNNKIVVLNNQLAKKKEENRELLGINNILNKKNNALSTQLKEKKDELHDSHTISQKNLDNNITLSNQLFILKKENKDLRGQINDLKEQNKDLIELLKESKQIYTYKKTRKNGEYKK